MVDSDSQIDGNVLSLVDHIWTEAQGDLENLLSVPIDSINLSTVDKAESLLLSIIMSLKSKSFGIFDLDSLQSQFYDLIPHKKDHAIDSLMTVRRKMDLCQLIRDVVSVSEATNWTKCTSTKAKYKTLGCAIKHLPENSDEFDMVAGEFLASQLGGQEIVVQNVYEVHRPMEDDCFRRDIDNKRLLFHSSQAKNFVGILSRGLLLPRVVVDDFGGTRSDPGMLGSGIYFASSARYFHFICHLLEVYFYFKSIFRSRSFVTLENYGLPWYLIIYSS